MAKSKMNPQERYKLNKMLSKAWAKKGWDEMQPSIYISYAILGKIGLGYII